MTVFFNASAIVAIMSNEARFGETMFHALRSANAPVTSDLALWEAAIALFRKAGDRGAPVGMPLVRDQLSAFLAEFGVATMVTHPDDWRLASDAFATFGKRSGSPARLNMADCFHYAVARRLGAAILFSSADEFHHTDLDCVPA